MNMNIVYSLLLVISVTSAQDTSVSYQVSISHDGYSMTDVNPPLCKQWSINNIATYISHPLIVNGRVFVSGANLTDSKKLFAIKAQTGEIEYTIDLEGPFGWAGLSYDSGFVYTVNADCLVQAFKEEDGKLIWSRKLSPSCSSEPTSTGGVVYVLSQSTLSALDGYTGGIKWTATGGSFHSAPTIVPRRAIYTPCKANSITDGQVVWSYPGSFQRTTAYHNESIYFRKSIDDGKILSYIDGAEVGTIPSTVRVIPAFVGDVVVYLNGATLEGYADDELIWSFAGDGQFVTAPLIVNLHVYVGSLSGMIYAVNWRTGENVWSDKIYATILGPDEQSIGKPLTGLGAGESILVVPAKNLLVSYWSCPK